MAGPRLNAGHRFAKVVLLLAGLAAATPAAASVQAEVGVADEIIRQVVAELDTVSDAKRRIATLTEAVEAISVLERLADLGDEHAKASLQGFATQAITPDVLRLSLVGALSEEILPGETGLRRDLDAKAALEKIVDPAYRTAAWTNLARAHVKAGQMPETERLAVNAIEDAKRIDRRQTRDGALRAAVLVFLDTRPSPGIIDIATNAMATAGARSEIYEITAKAGVTKGSAPSQDELARQAKDLLTQKKHAEALVFAQALNRDDERRADLLEALLNEALAVGDEAFGLETAKSMARDRDQNKALRKIIDMRLERGKALRAKEVVPLLLTIKARMDADIDIAMELDRQGYKLAALEILRAQTISAADEPEATANLAAALANLQSFDEARRIAGSIAAREQRSFAFSRVSKRLADAERIEEAQALLAEVSQADDLAFARSGIARAHAKKGQIGEAQALLSTIPIGDHRDRVLEELVENQAKSGSLEQARDFLKQARTPAARCRMLITIALASQKISTDAAKAVLEEAVGAVAGAPADDSFADIALAYARIGDIGQADKMLASISDKDIRGKVERRIADLLVQKGALEDAKAWLAKLPADTAHSRLQAELAYEVYQNDGQVEAFVSAMRDLPYGVRVQALRRMSENRARQLDRSGWLTDGSTDPLVPDMPEKVTHSANFVFGSQSVQAPAPVTRSLSGKQMPDIFAPTAATMRAAVGAPADGMGHLAILGFSPFSLEAFKLTNSGDSAIHQVQVSQQLTWPRYIAVEKGTVTLGALMRDMPEIRERNLLVADGDVLLVRVPIIVLPGATLLMSGAEFSQYRLGARSGAFLAVAGKLVVQDAEIIGYDEIADMPAVADESSKAIFRPFITAWGGSDLQIAGSRLAMLGYDSSKAFGLTQSSGAAVQSLYVVKDNEPTGNIIDNSFENLRYGYYSYEADAVRLIGNEYRDNVIYGIDPHDRSRDLVIALNTSYGAQQKHGITVSREVNDSFIVGNVSLWNKGSGIMLDRTSGGNIIYANTALSNGGDGLTFYESGCNIAAFNEFSQNRRSGIRVRNSTDVGMYDNVIAGNKGSGADVYVADLTQSPEGSSRDFQLDPFQPISTTVIAGNAFSSNRTAISVNGASHTILDDNTFRNQTSNIYGGDLRQVSPYLLQLGDTSAIVTDTACKPATPVRACNLGNWTNPAPAETICTGMSLPKRAAVKDKAQQDG